MKLYFIEVTRHLTVNKMGRELSEYVNSTYNHTLVSEEEFPEVVKDLKRVQGELERKYPRCKPFEYRERQFAGYDYSSPASPYISVRPNRSSSNDTPVYILRTTVVRDRTAGTNDFEQAGSPT